MIERVLYDNIKKLMLEFIRTAKKRGAIVEIVHQVFNVCFAAILIGLVVIFESPWLAIGLLVISKWRVIAVRPRYWWTNFLGSLPDLIFGIAIVILSWGAGVLSQEYIAANLALSVPAWVVQLGFTVFYALWLTMIKPRHSQLMVGIQALLCQFMGLTAIFFVSHQLPLAVALVLVFITVYASARHAIGIFEEAHQDLLASMFALLIMELAYTMWHWSVLYQLTPLIRIPQIAIIVAAISVTAWRVYRAWQDDRKVTWDELGPPLLFMVGVTLVILFGFSGLL